MTTYHVWLTGHDQPEVVRAHAVGECSGALSFYDIHPRSHLALVREFQPHEWQRWSVVHDEADHVHI